MLAALPATATAAPRAAVLVPQLKPPDSPIELRDRFHDSISRALSAIVCIRMSTVE